MASIVEGALQPQGASPSEGASPLAQLRAFAAQVRQELEVQARELAEVAMLIKQTSTEIDRLTPQRNEAARRLREIENALDHFSTADIKRTYGASLESQMRLFMMQSRLEQLEYKQRTAERSQRQLERFVSLVESVPNMVQQADFVATEDKSTQEVAARVIQAQEGELHRVSRHINDHTAQTLANLVLRVQICERLVESGEPRGREELHHLRDGLAASLQDVRRLIFELRPLILEDLGLVPTLRKYVQLATQAASDHTMPQMEMLFTGPEQRLDAHVEVATFRLVQEAINNALRHAQASRIRVTVASEGGHLRCTVEDDGVGFDSVAMLKAVRQRKVLGVGLMLDRAATLGASITFDSKLGSGTTVHIDVPLDQPPSGAGLRPT